MALAAFALLVLWFYRQIGNDNARCIRIDTAYHLQPPPKRQRLPIAVAGLVAGCLGGDYWLSSSGLVAFAFLVAFLGGNFLFRKVVSSCLE
jgi:hypothetical protein